MCAGSTLCSCNAAPPVTSTKETGDYDDADLETALRIIAKWGEPPTRSNQVWQARLDNAVREAYAAGMRAGRIAFAIAARAKEPG